MFKKNFSRTFDLDLDVRSDFNATNPANNETVSLENTYVDSLDQIIPSPLPNSNPESNITNLYDDNWNPFSHVFEKTKENTTTSSSPSTIVPKWLTGKWGQVRYMTKFNTLINPVSNL